MNFRLSPAARVARGGVTFRLVSTGSSSLTVTVAVPAISPDAAVTVAVPATRAVKTPSSSIAPTVGSLLDQAISMPGMALPSWSRAVATNPFVSPTMSVAEDGVTVMSVRAGSTGTSGS